MKKHTLSLLIAGVLIIGTGSAAASIYNESPETLANLAEVKYFAQKAALGGLTPDESKFVNVMGGSSQKYLGSRFIMSIIQDIVRNSAGNVASEVRKTLAAYGPDYVAYYDNLTPKVPAEFAGRGGALALPAPAASSSYALVPGRR